MYADDIVIFSNTKSGLQKKLDKLHEYCKEWCLEINLSKTQVLIFNKPGKHLKDNFTFNNNTIECVNDYKYLGMKFTSSGIFFSFLHAAELVLNIPVISLPYIRIGLIVWSYK
jgi:tyrosine-protein phosphatase YwqE